MRILFILIFIISCGGKGGKDSPQTGSNKCAISYLQTPFCPRNAQPVCANFITYANACQAVKNGETDCSEGACSPVTAEGCICSNDYNPVCVTTAEGNKKTYSNECLAICGGHSNLTLGECSVNCEEFSGNEVCGRNGETYKNSCFAYKANVEFIQGNCSNSEVCNCSNVETNPVCGSNGQTYSNVCLAKCAGIIETTPSKCEDLCICPLENNPVCGSDKNTYSNPCNANCAGVTYEMGKCPIPPPIDDSMSCDCEGILNPVCGVDGNTYINSCEANCENVTFSPGECKDRDEIEECSTNIKIKVGLFCGFYKSKYRILINPKECQGDTSLTIVNNLLCRSFNCRATDKPVCGSNGIEYKNQCEARIAGIYQFKKGECKDKKPVCWCKNINKPVCAGGITFKNKCLAIISGKKITKEQACDKR